MRTSLSPAANVGGALSTGGASAQGVGGNGGDAKGTGGGVGKGGTAGSGGIGGMGGTIGSGVYGMPCTTSDDCPRGAICCDGSDESCDGTRLPSGDGTNTGEFVSSAGGSTVTDTITGLVWQADGSGRRSGCSRGAYGVGSGELTCTWAEAKSYCASLTLNGVPSWRLPAPHELQTIVDLAKDNPASDPTAFPNTTSSTMTSYYWTSSSAFSSGTAWEVDFSVGFLQS